MSKKSFHAGNMKLGEIPREKKVKLPPKSILDTQIAVVNADKAHRNYLNLSGLSGEEDAKKTYQKHMSALEEISPELHASTRAIHFADMEDHVTRDRMRALRGQGPETRPETPARGTKRTNEIRRTARSNMEKRWDTARNTAAKNDTRTGNPYGNKPSSEAAPKGPVKSEPKDRRGPQNEVRPETRVTNRPRAPREGPGVMSAGQTRRKSPGGASK